MNGIKGYISIREASRLVRSWAISEDTKKPFDPRKADTNRMSRRVTSCQNRNGT